MVFAACRSLKEDPFQARSQQSTPSKAFTTFDLSRFLLKSSVVGDAGSVVGIRTRVPVVFAGVPRGTPAGSQFSKRPPGATRPPLSSASLGAVRPRFSDGRLVSRTIASELGRFGFTNPDPELRRVRRPARRVALARRPEARRDARDLRELRNSPSPYLRRNARSWDAVRPLAMAHSSTKRKAWKTWVVGEPDAT